MNDKIGHALRPGDEVLVLARVVGRSGPNLCALEPIEGRGTNTGEWIVPPGTTVLQSRQAEPKKEGA